MKNKLKHFLLLTASTLIMAVGVYFFKFANNFTFGGITGLAVLIAKTGVMSAGDFTFITNMLLLILGFIILGSKFAAKTAYCSILLSVALSALERIFPMSHPLTDQPMLELCFAIALPALGSAILFNIGSSSGASRHRYFDHDRRMFRLRYRNRTVFIPRTCDPFFYDRHVHRKFQPFQVFQRCL